MQQQRGLVVIPVSIQREASQPAGLSREQRLEMHRGMQALAFSWQDMVDQFKKHVPGRTAPPRPVLRPPTTICTIYASRSTSWTSS